MSVEIWSFTIESGVDPTAQTEPDRLQSRRGGRQHLQDRSGHVDTGSSQIVVDPGPWILGEKVVLPAGVIGRVDPSDEAVFVNRTKDQIKDSPKSGEDPEHSGLQTVRCLRCRDSGYVSAMPLILGIILLIVAIAGGVIIHPVVFALAIVAIVLFFTHRRAAV
jgi:hypothetical protein